MALFDGVTVVELGHVLAAPFAATMMADNGARVIKVEDPGRGDMVRGIGIKGNLRLTWRSLMRNKESITADLRTSEGQAIVRELAARADVLVENFRPGTLDKWNIGWDTLHRVNPKLIMLQVSGFGQFGPESKRPAYGRVGEAMSGAVYANGHPEMPPTHFGFSLGDAASGLMGAFGIAGALFRKATLGDRFDGERIDIALYETMFRLFDWQTLVHDQTGFVPQRTGNRTIGPSPISGTFCSSDGVWFTVASGTVNSVWAILEMIGGPELRNDPRYGTHEGQMDARDVLEEQVKIWVAGEKADRVESEAAKYGVSLGKVYSIAEIFKDPIFRLRQNIVSVEEPELGKVQMVGVMPWMQNARGSVRSPAPRLGEHTDGILADYLGYDAKAIAALREKKVI